MKQKLLLITITLAMLTTTAQETPKHKWDIGAEISSPEEFTAPNILFQTTGNGSTKYYEKDYYAFSVGLFGSYYLKNDIFIRLRVSTCNRKISNHSENIGDTTSTPFVRDETFRQKSGTFVLGIGKNIVEQKFIRATIGFELSTTFFGKFINNYSSTDMAGFGGDTWIENRTYIASGGYAIRLGPFVGGQFIFSKNFSIGPEISYAFQYYNTGGEATQRFVGVNVNNNANSFDYYTHSQSSKFYGAGFTKIKAVIRMAYAF